VERRQATLLLGQEPLLQQLADDALDRFRQAALTFATAGLPEPGPSPAPPCRARRIRTYTCRRDSPAPELPYRPLHARPSPTAPTAR
jgi:hypothetical protein